MKNLKACREAFESTINGTPLANIYFDGICYVTKDATQKKLADDLTKRFISFLNGVEFGNRPEQGWVKVSEKLPEPLKPVLVFYKNKAGENRVVRAEYIPAHTVLVIDYIDCDVDYDGEYFDGDDEAYVRESWHELIDNWWDYSGCVITGGEVTHWRPLPPAPEEGR